MAFVWDFGKQMFNLKQKINMETKVQGLDISPNDAKRVLPAVFSSVEEAVNLLKLDKRHKWEEWNGELSYPFWYTAPCSGCSCDCSDGYGCNHGNSGCHECGYTGKRRNVVPVPAFMPDGSTVRVVPQNGR